jgi:hypothetical protein
MRTARRRSALALIALALAAGVSAVTGPVLWLSRKASGTAAWVAKKTLSRLVRMTSRNSDSGMSSIRRGGHDPAQVPL